MKRKFNLTRFKHIDMFLLLAMLALVVIGLMAIYSASIYTAFYEGASQSGYLLKQMLGFVLGISCYLFCISVPYKKYLNIRVISGLLFICFLMLVVVLFTPPVLGASRWITFGEINFQPSELTKIVYILFLAYWFSQYEETCYYDGLKFLSLFAVWNSKKKRERAQLLNNKKFWRRLAIAWGIPIVITGAIAVLLYLEPDNGSLVITLFIFGVLGVVNFFRSRKNRIIIFGVILFLVGALAFKDEIVATTLPFFEDSHIGIRLRAWADPFADYEGDGYQLSNAYIAIAKGGVMGAGIGNGSQKQGYLPEGHTDFILANIAEETGLIGIATVLGLFYLIIYRSIRAAVVTTNRQAKLTIIGLSALFFIQIFWNAAGISGLLPMKGLTAPFLSYGATSIMFMVITLGLIQGIIVQTNYEASKRKER